MTNQQRYQQRPQQSAARNQQRRNQTNGNGELTLEQHAGAVARQLIQQTGIEDSTPIWKALKRAYLAGYEDAQR
jgi:hypothetical protein